MRGTDAVPPAWQRGIASVLPLDQKSRPKSAAVPCRYKKPTQRRNYRGFDTCKNSEYNGCRKQGEYLEAVLLSRVGPCTPALLRGKPCPWLSIVVVFESPFS